MKRLLVLVALATGLSTHAWGQTYTGQIPANTVLGNSTGSSLPFAVPGPVINNQFATMASGTVKCNPVSSSAGTPKDCNYPVVNVVDSGADPTGASDSTTAIQNAINALPVSGGDVLFPPGTYKVASITIGNGSSSAASTRYGVRLIGLGQPIWGTAYSGYPTVPAVKLLWNGTVGGTMISVNGPLQSWAIQNMFLDGNNSAANGIFAISAQYGDNANLSLQNFTSSAIETTTLTSSSGPSLASTVSQFNSWRNISITIANTLNAKGIFLTGQGATADTDFNLFRNVSLVMPTVQTYGIYLQGADSNTFMDVDIIGTGNASSIAVIFDYTLVNSLPADNSFYGINVTITSGTPFGTASSPGGSSRPNRIKGLTLVNGITLPVVPNLTVDFPDTRSFVNLTGQTSQINQTLYTPLYRGLLRINYYLVITTGGTGGTMTGKILWSDNSSTAQSITSSTVNANTVGSFVSGSVIVDASTGSAVTHQVNFSGVTGNPQFTWVVTAERLN